MSCVCGGIESEFSERLWLSLNPAFAKQNSCFHPPTLNEGCGESIFIKNPGTHNFPGPDLCMHFAQPKCFANCTCLQLCSIQLKQFLGLFVLLEAGKCLHSERGPLPETSFSAQCSAVNSVYTCSVYMSQVGSNLRLSK